MPITPAGAGLAGAPSFSPGALGFMRAGMLFGRLMPFFGTALLTAIALRELYMYAKTRNGISAWDNKGWNVTCDLGGVTHYNNRSPAVGCGGGQFLQNDVPEAYAGPYPNGYFGWQDRGDYAWLFGPGWRLWGSQYVAYPPTPAHALDPPALVQEDPMLFPVPIGYPFPGVIPDKRDEPAIAPLWRVATPTVPKSRQFVRGIPVFLPRWAPSAARLAQAMALRTAQADVRSNGVPLDIAGRGVGTAVVPGLGEVPDRRPSAPAIPVGIGAGVATRPGVVVIPEAVTAGVVPIAPAIPGVRVPVIPATGTAVIVTPMNRVLSRPVVLARAASVPARPIRELKVRAFAHLQGLRMGFSAATEPQDLLKALWKAIPPCARTSTPAMRSQAKKARANGWNSKYSAASPSIASMTADLSNYLGKLARDPSRTSASVCSSVINPTPGVHRNASGSALQDYAARAMKGILDNEFKDYAFGRMGREMGNISRGLNTPFGIQMMKRISETAGGQ